MLTLELLIEKAQQEAVSQEEVVETIKNDPDFYIKLFEESSKRERKIIKELLTDTILQETNSLLRTNLENFLKINNFDDITTKKTSQGLRDVIGFKVSNPNEFKSRLI